MSKNIFWIVATKVKEGELENLKTLKEEMTEYTKTNEPGALKFEWFISSDDKYCHLFESYSDPPAAIVHMKSFGKNYAQRFMSILEVKNFTVYGEPTEELMKILNPLGVVILNPSGGFERS
ncbi:MAG: hypothetical protein IPL53_24665 [Ignavibacteria bacterium]|nr:hypothetical protein [Ignavibacteria bacterium]